MCLFLVITEDVKSGPSALVISLCLLCLVALMLPTAGEMNTSVPQYLHLTVNQKLIAAYILGKLLIMKIVKLLYSNVIKHSVLNMFFDNYIFRFGNNGNF